MSKSKKSRTYKEWIKSIRIALIARYLDDNDVDFKNLVHTPYCELKPHEIGMLSTLVDVFRVPCTEFHSPAFALYALLVEYNESLPF